MDDGMQRTTRWWSRLRAKLACFRPHGHPQRIADASPEAGAASAEQAAAGAGGLFHNTRHAPQPAVAFVAPPPSPASSALTSGSPSPAVLVNANISSSYSSPTASIFAVGPYAREPQQLVSPPAFSAGLTEPSTAPLTPPAELSCSPHLLATAPSSPEVPFARFLWHPVAAADHHQQHFSGGGGGGAEGLLNAYQLQPGSPILVSPGSTSSSPPSWTVRARNEGVSLLDGGRIPITEEGGGDCGSGSASRNDDTHDDEAAKSGGEFVFGSNADVAGGGEVAGGGSLALGDVTEQWPFHLAHC
ncbi:uncharacterized protein At1g76660-like [Panicum virgatum]|uniref:uncharacterized protein At1g76660-like n=1 Tax=Panicum virgatum TaxID=38727 RepID=UPI0019D65494|nr:uncharacterized protein At1g76660-like [Panicum virgatum]